MRSHLKGVLRKRQAGPAVGALDIPVLAIVGGRDELIDSRRTRARLQRLAPRAEVVFLPDGRHFLPGQTGRVMDFLVKPIC